MADSGQFLWPRTQSDPQNNAVKLQLVCAYVTSVGGSPFPSGQGWMRADDFGVMVTGCGGRWVPAVAPHA